MLCNIRAEKIETVPIIHSFVMCFFVPELQLEELKKRLKS